MTGALKVICAGPSLTVQDFGRTGYLDCGLSAGGAADKLALIEGAVLLGQSLEHAALEMAGFGGTFEATADIRIALTGAPMTVRLDEAPLLWNASHFISAGQRLSVGRASRGVYGYLSVSGGLATEPFLGSRSTHLAGGIGRRLEIGDLLPVGLDEHADIGPRALPVEERFSGGLIRMVPSAQTQLFTQSQLRRFAKTKFWRGARGNRQGVQLEFEGAPFASGDQLLLLSEVMVVGDVQMTGDGAPFVLLPECQTTGGYPRIGTVVPQDLPKIAQAATSSMLRFDFVSRDLAEKSFVDPVRTAQALQLKVAPQVRNPHDINDLLSYQLISGATTGKDDL